MEYFEYMDTMMTEVRDWDEAQQEEDACDESEWEDLYEDPDYEMGFDPYLGCYTDDC